MRCHAARQPTPTPNQPSPLALTAHPSPPPPRRPLPRPRSYWRVRGELQRRDRELAKLVVRIMSLQEVLSTYRRLPVARYTHHTTTTTTHAAVTGFAHSMAYL